MTEKPILLESYMNMQMMQQTLLCGYEIISPIGKGRSEVRRQGQVVFTGTYRQCHRWAENRRLLMSQAPCMNKDEE